MRRPAQRQAAALAAVLCASVLALKSTTTVAVRVTPDAGLSGAAGIDAAAAAAASAANSYKPVFLMHGVTGSGSDLAQNVQWIQEAHPGQVAVTLEIYDAVKSLAPLPLQVQNIAHKIRTLAQQYNCSESGYHLVGHSQGALLMRAVAQEMDDHAVSSLVSMAGPQMGEFGVPGDSGWIVEFESILTPEELEEIEHDASGFFYSKVGQLTSVGGYWNDPVHHDEFLQSSAFLPGYNGERDDAMERRRANLLRVENVYLFASSDDEIIKPRLSGLFQFYKYGETPTNETLVDMEEMPGYDLTGLKQMVDEGRLQRTDVPGLRHDDWRRNKQIFEKHILTKLT